MTSYSQQSFKYIIIPTTFKNIGKGFNPYNVSSSLQKELNDKGIKTIFESVDSPADYYDALVVELNKASSLLNNKLNVKLKDYQNNVVWSNDGIGYSKEYAEGYREAIVHAFRDFKELPIKKTVVWETAPNISSQNIYFDEKYIVDVVTKAEKIKNIVVVNGEALGYEKLQNIAILISTDMPEMFKIEWTMPDGNILKGVAELSDTMLKVTLSSDNAPLVIRLMKK